MEYKKIKEINEYKSESINPMKTPDTMYELYSVPFFTTGHPEYLYGSEIGSSKVIVQKNDILVCKINPRINRVWVVSDESNYQSIASSEWIVVRNAQYNPYFLAWYFRTPMFQQLMTSEVTGIGGSLTRAQPKRVAEYPVPVLSRERQDKIVSILNRLESIKRERKSELDLLDSLVKARFVEMFGDFRPNYTKWDIVSLDSVCTKISDGEHGSVPRVDKGHLYLNAKNIKIDGSIDWQNTTYISSEDHERIYKRCNPEMNDILLTTTGTIGNVAIVPAVEPFSLDRGITLLKLNDKKICSAFLMCLLKSKYLQQCMKKSVHASAIGHLFLNQVKILPVLLPSLELQNQFSDFVRYIDKSKIAIDSCIIIIEKALQSRYHYVWGICHDQF